jgi:hypothetical protein
VVNILSALQALAFYWKTVGKKLLDSHLNPLVKVKFFFMALQAYIIVMLNSVVKSFEVDVDSGF